MTTQRTTPRPGWLVPAMVAAVAILAVVIGLIVANFIDDAPGDGEASPSPSAVVSGEQSVPPSAGPTASVEPSPSVEAEATPVVQPPDGFLPPGSIARVTAGELPMYEEPTTTSQILTTLGSDELVGVGFSYLHPDWGPVEADGATWYPVRSLERTDMPPVPSEPLEPTENLGWVDGASLALMDPRCVADEPTLEILQSLVPWEQLACYGDASLTIQGTFGCGGCGGARPGEFEPEWLASPLNFNLLSVDPNERLGPFALSFPPDVEMPEAASIIRVTGHFSDPAAAECSVAPGDPPTPIDTEVAELYCREMFVVESFEVIGVDEDFPFG